MTSPISNIDAGLAIAVVLARTKDAYAVPTPSLTMIVPSLNIPGRLISNAGTPLFPCNRCACLITSLAMPTTTTNVCEDAVMLDVRNTDWPLSVLLSVDHP